MVEARVFPAGLLLAAVLCTGPAAAADDDVARARASREAGDQAMLRGDAATARARYAEAYARVHDPALLYNLGQAEQMLGHNARAFELFTEFEGTAADALKQKVPELNALLTETRLRTATLEVSSPLADTTALIADRERPVALAPAVTTIVVDPGEVRIELRHAQYVSDLHTVSVAVQRTARVPTRFAPWERGATLSFRGTPAHVAVNGHEACVAPCEHALAPGTHSIVWTADGFVTAKDSVTVRGNETRTLDRELERGSPKLTSQWWFWTAAGAVVLVGAGAAYFAATTERNGDRGTLAPGQLSTALKF